MLKIDPLRPPVTARGPTDATAAGFGWRSGGIWSCHGGLSGAI